MKELTGGRKMYVSDGIKNSRFNGIDEEHLYVLIFLMLIYKNLCYVRGCLVRGGG